MNDSIQMGEPAHPSATGAHQPDPHGRAALLLAESILHTLINKRILSNADAVLTVRIASEVEEEVSVHNGESQDRSESFSLLSAIEQSFAADADGLTIVR